MRIDMAMGMQNQQLVEKNPTSFIRQWFISTKKYRPIIYTIFLCVVIVILTTKNITKDDTISFISSLLFVTTPYIVKFSRVVMSEIFSLSFIILTIYLFFKYYKSNKNRDAFTFSISLIMSICARYTSVFMIPIFFCHFIF